MKKLRGLLLWAWHHKKRSALILVILVIVGFFLVPKPAAKIATVTVKKTKIVQSVTASGTVDSATTVDLTFLSGGKLSYVGAKKGDTVSVGKTIAALDQRSMQKTLSQTLIDYSKQRNTFEQLSDLNLDHTPQNALNDSMKRILENNQYDLNKAVNSVELQQLVIEQSVISSPIAGIVTRADAEIAGLNIAPTTTWSIADPDNLVINIDVDEADIGKIKIGQEINSTFDAYPNQTIPLRVSFVDFASHKSDTGGTVYTVKANLPKNNDKAYRIGMAGDVEIIINQKNDVLTIPLSSLIDDSHVYVKSGKTFSKRKITTALQSDTDTEVTSGLKEGEEIALSPDDVTKTLK